VQELAELLQGELVEHQCFARQYAEGVAVVWLAARARRPARWAPCRSSRANPIIAWSEPISPGTLSKRLEQNVRVRDRALLQPKTPDRRGRGLSIMAVRPARFARALPCFFKFSIPSPFAVS
jgi:hypothetical protein